MQGLVVLSRSEFSILRSSLTNPASSWDKYIEASFQTRFVTAEIDIENELARMQGLVESMRMQHASTSIKTQLSTLETSLAVLSRKIGEQDTAEDRTTVLHYIENHTRIVAHLRRGLRKALLKVRANQVAHQKTVRRNLFDRPEEVVDGATTGATKRNSGNHSNLSTKARIASKNKSFTDGLSRTRALLSSEIKRSAEALASLETGVNTIVDAKKEYAEYGQALGSGKSLINQLTQREITDRVLTVLGFVFFLLTVLYIAQNRLGNVVEYLDIFGLLQTTATTATTTTTTAAAIHADVQETATAVLEETLQYNQEL